MRKKFIYSGCPHLDRCGDHCEVYRGIQQNLSVKASWRRRDRPLPDGYPLIMLCLSISSAGLPVAISIMVAERNAVNGYWGGQKYSVSL